MAELIIRRGLEEPDTSGNFVPHKPQRPEKLERQHPFRIVSEYQPAGDQPTAIPDPVSRIPAADQTQVALERLAPGRILGLSRAAFSAATEGLVERVGGCVASLLVDAGVSRDRIDTLYFTGGASGVPQLRARIAAALPSARSIEGDLYGSIGAGLAVEAARRYG